MLKLHSLEDIDYIEGDRVFHYTCNPPKEKTNGRKFIFLVKYQSTPKNITAKNKAKGASS